MDDGCRAGASPKVGAAPIVWLGDSACHDATLGARLAVLVQQLVPADAAGVLFSANPVTNRRDEAVVTTGYGLGESIVGGTVAPDTYTVRKGGPGGPQIVDRQLGNKALMTVPVD